MILFHSPLIRLDYSPATDILIADLSDSYEFYLLEVQEALSTMAKNIRYYDVKRVLMDSRKRIVRIEDDKYAALMKNFIQELQTTRLQKLARLHSGNTSRENIAKTMQEQVITSFVMKTFTDKDLAINWLKEN